METILAIKLDKAVITLADTNAGRSIVKMKDDEDKILVLDEHKLMLACGENGDRAQFCEYIAKNVSLYAMRNDYSLSTHATANFVRGELARAIREGPYNVNLIIAGMDKDVPSVYYLDYLGNMQSMTFTCHGYAGYFLLSLLDKYYQEGMGVEDGVKLLELCIKELRTRMVVNSKYIAKVVDANGIRIIPLEVSA